MTLTTKQESRFNVNTGIKDEVSEILSEISEILKQTYGPFGSTTLIQDRFLNHQVTKDGYTVLKNIFSKDQTTQLIVELIRKISQKTVREVGDGSTSSVIIADGIYQNTKSLMDDKLIYPRDVAKVLKDISSFISREIKDTYTRSIDLENEADFEKLKNIANVATNNRSNISELICEIYKQIGTYGIINIENGVLGTEDRYEIMDGIEVPRGMLDPRLANFKTEDDFNATLENCNVLMVNGRVEDGDIDNINKIVTACFNKTESVLIIASSFSTNAKEYFFSIAQSNRNKAPFCAVEIATESKKQIENFFDTAVYSGADPVDKVGGETLEEIEDFEKFMEDKLGFANKVIVREQATEIYEGRKRDEDFNDHVDSVEKKISELLEASAHLDNDEEVARLKVRLSRLKGNAANFFVGGETKEEQEAHKYLIEDAVLAVRSSLRHGYTVAANLLPAIILQNNRGELLDVLAYKFPNIDLVIFKKIVTNVLEGYKSAIRYIYEGVNYGNIKDTVFAKIEEQNLTIVDRDKFDIVDYMVDNKVIFNLNSREFELINSTNILCSGNTDSTIATGVFSIVTLIATSNQIVHFPR